MTVGELRKILEEFEDDFIIIIGDYISEGDFCTVSPAIESDTWYWGPNGENYLHYVELHSDPVYLEW